MKCELMLFGWLVAGPATAGWFGPSTYEECVLENIKGVSSNGAALAVRLACNKQFPLPPRAPEPQPLSADPSAAEKKTYETQLVACVRADEAREAAFLSRGGSSYSEAACRWVYQNR